MYICIYIHICIYAYIYMYIYMISRSQKNAFLKATIQWL